MDPNKARTRPASRASSGRVVSSFINEAYRGSMFLGVEYIVATVMFQASMALNRRSEDFKICLGKRTKDRINSVVLIR